MVKHVCFENWGARVQSIFILLVCVYSLENNQLRSCRELPLMDMRFPCLD